MLRRPPRSTLFPSTPLSRSLAVGVPRPRLLDDPRLGRDIHQQRLVADPLVEHDVELGLTERRRHFRPGEHTSELQSPWNLVSRLLLSTNTTSRHAPPRRPST